jgi:[acyl-carrier-protein] S-malonyltransferase
MKTAFIFPGQASQYVGMGADLYKEFDSIKSMFDRASTVLNYDLAEVCFNGPEDKLKQTAYTQPAVFVHSCALDSILKQNNIVPNAAAGHSLGEYSALVSAKALTFEQAVEAIGVRSRAMQEDCDKVPGTMAAVIGMSYNDITENIKNIDGIVVPANYNSDGQVVIAGEAKAVNTACELLKSKGAKRAMPIPVGGAYHSPLMAESAEFMSNYINSKLPLENLSFPVYSNVAAEPETSGGKFSALLAKQIPNPVLWYTTILNMYRDGIRKFVEVGPGKVLQGLVKRSLKKPDIEIHGIDNLEELNSFLGKM